MKKYMFVALCGLMPVLSCLAEPSIVWQAEDVLTKTLEVEVGTTVNINISLKEVVRLYGLRDEDTNGVDSVEISFGHKRNLSDAAFEKGDIVAKGNLDHLFAFAWTPEQSGYYRIVMRLVGHGEVVGQLIRACRIWHVDANKGDDSNSGVTGVTPFRTIQKAIDVASEGDEVLVDDGRYEPISVADKVITIKSVNGSGRTVIDGGETNRCVLLSKSRFWPDGAMIEGFSLENGVSTFDDTLEGFAGGVFGGYVKNCVIRNCRAIMGGGAAFVELESCIVSNCVASMTGGGAQSCDVVNCLLAYNEAVVDGGGCADSYILNSTVVENHIPGVAWGLSIGAMGNMAGIGYNSSVINSIVWGNYFLVESNGDSESGRGLLSGRCYEQEDRADKYSPDMCEIVNSCIPLSSSVRNSFSSDPCFRDPEHGDYRLQPWSPCIDSGTNSVVHFQLDLDGNERLCGQGVDIGAYEYIPNGDSMSVVTFMLGERLLRTGGGELVQSVTNRHAAVAPTISVLANYVFLGWDKDFSLIVSNLTVTARVKQLAANAAFLPNEIFRDMTLDAATVYAVTGTVRVVAGASLTIPAMTVVKFLEGSSLIVEDGAFCKAAGAIFTHIADDTIGGDTLMDGDELKPEQDSYLVKGVTDDETTEYRYFTKPTVTLSGTLSKNETWSGHQVYHVTGNLTVPRGVTLTVEPGAIIKFDAGKSLTVSGGGTLNAFGTRAQPIVFTSIKDDSVGGDTNRDGDATKANGGDWKYVHVSGTANLKYCHGFYGAPGNETGIFESHGGSLSMDCCTIGHSRYDGVWNWGGSVVAKNCIFFDCGNAVCPYQGRTTCNNCVMVECNYGFMDWSHWVGGTFGNCIFYKCGRGWSDTNSAGTQFWSHSRLSRCCFFNPEGFDVRSCVKDGVDGCIYADPLFENSANGDFRLKSGSPCIDAGDGSVAMAVDYYGQTRQTVDAATAKGTKAANGNYPDIGVYEFMPREVVADVDFEAVEVSAPATLTVGEKATVSWTVRNVGSAYLNGSWRDKVELVCVNGAVVELGTAMNVASLAPGASQTFTKEFAVPVVPCGTANVRLTANSERDIFEGTVVDNNQATSASVEIEVPRMSAGGESRVLLPAGTVAAFEIPADSQIGAVMAECEDGVSLSGALGHVPLGYVGDVEAVRVHDSALFISVPVDRGEKSFVVVARNDSAVERNVKLVPQLDSFKVFDVEPRCLSTSGVTELRMTGTGLGDVSRVILSNGMGGRVCDSLAVTMRSPQQLNADFELNDVAAGRYSVLVERRNGDLVSSEIDIDIVPPIVGPRLSAELILPNTIRSGRSYTGMIRYANTGDVDMPAPAFLVKVESGSLNYQTDELPRNCLEFYGRGRHRASVLQAGEVRTIDFVYVGESSAQVELESSMDSLDCPQGWGSHADYIAALGRSADRLSHIGVEPIELEEVRSFAESMRDDQDLSTLFGTLTFADGTPVPNHCLCFTNGVGSMICRTDANGRFTCLSITPGEYGIENQLGTSQNGVSVKIQPGTDNKVDFVVENERSCEVWVNGGDDLVDVAAVSEGDGMKYDGFNVGHGRWSFNGLPDGWYKAYATSDEMHGCVRFQVEGGVSEFSPVMTIKPYGGISGDVSGLAEEDRDAPVWIVGNLDERIVVPDEQGHYEVADLLEGYYSISMLSTNMYKYVNGDVFVSAASNATYDIHPLSDQLHECGAGLLMAKTRLASSDDMPSGDDFSKWLAYGWKMYDEHKVTVPVGKYRCSHNLAKCRSDIQIRTNFSEFLNDMESIKLEGDVNALLIPYMQGVTLVGQQAWEQYIKQIKNLKVLQQCLLDIMNFFATSAWSKTAELDEIGSAAEGAYEAVGNILSCITDIHDATQLAHNVDKLLLYTDQFVRGCKKFQMHGSVRTDGLLLKKIQPVMDVLDYINDLKQAWDVGNEIAKANYTFSDARRRMKDFGPAVKSHVLAFLQSAAGFNNYHLCRRNTSDADVIYGRKEYVVTTRVVKSYDPNEMVGPVGAGEQRLVKPGEWMDYIIYFENKSDATASAQEIWVDLPMDPSLDWSTLELGEIAFGSHIDPGLLGKTGGNTEYRPGDSDCSVKTEVKVEGGALKWYLRSWDPNTVDHFPANVADGFLPPNDETGRGEGHLCYRVKVKDEVSAGTKINASATIVFDTNDPITTDPAWWNTVSSTAVETSGQYVTLDLADELGLEIPDDVDYAAGDKVTVKVEGLAKGLKLVTTPVYEDPNAKKKVIVDYVYTIEGVPTEPVDFEKQPMYARVTVTYKDKTKTADKTGKAETLQPVKLSIESAEVRTLAAGALNAVYEPVDIVALWPEVADAKANPKEWSFKGWPAGLKYNATAKDASWSYKDDKATVKATAAPYTVYGQPTKAGEYPITATWKHKLADGKTTVSETFSAVLTVWGDDGASDFRAVSQAYVALTKNFGTGVTAMSGLPTGLKFTAKAVAATAKAPAQEVGDVYGTPTKPGVFAVTATKSDKTKETFLWKVTEGENPGLDAAAIGWADAKVKFDGGTKKATILQGLEADFPVDASALAAGAKVTVSGLPSGLKYDAKTGKITGIATKAESKVVTVKVVQNGVTEVRTFAIDVVANPFAGTYYAYLTDGSARETATAVLTPAVGGSVKVVLDEYVPSLGKTVKTTVSAKGFTMLKEYDPANPNAVKIAYDLELKANAKNNPDYASEVRALQLAFGSVKVGEGLVVFIGELVLKTGNDITCSGWAQKALTAAECAEVVDAIGFAPQSVLTGVFTDAGGGHLLYASAVLDEQKMQYKVTGKLGDGTVVKALLPIVYAFSEAAFYSAPCLLIEKGGAKRAYAMSFAHTKSYFAAKFWSHETAAAFQSCSAFVGEGIPVTAAEQLGGESELVLDAAELADFGYEGEAPVFRLMANGAELAKAKLDVYAPDAKEGAKPLASLASAKLQASAGYVFKGSFKWDAKVGGDGNTYSFELVPSTTDGKTFVGRCEVKPAKGMSVAVGAWTRIPMDI